MKFQYDFQYFPGIFFRLLLNNLPHDYTMRGNQLFFFESIKNYLFYLKTLIGPRLYRTKCFSWNFELENYLWQVNKKFSSGELCYSIKTLENDELNDKNSILFY